MADLGVANVVAHSPFVNQVDEELCVSCEICIASCQFDALALVDCSIQVNRVRCVGCGVCVPICEEGALGLIRRPEGEIPSIPPTQFDWQKERALARGQELNKIL
jgi:heterodisulfide reductase subunit A-like polyferredoxin